MATVLEETGLTMLDLKTAKMVTGREEGLTVRKFLIAAPPAKILDLSKLQLKVCVLLTLVQQLLIKNIQHAICIGQHSLSPVLEEEEEFYKLLPANKADHLCQLWQSCSDLHKIQTVRDVTIQRPCKASRSNKCSSGKVDRFGAALAQLCQTQYQG